MIKLPKQANMSELSLDVMLSIQCTLIGSPYKAAVSQYGVRAFASPLDLFSSKERRVGWSVCTDDKWRP
jgi:hypothetical protein